MATLGQSSKPSTSQATFGLNTKNQQALLVTLPSGGPWKITRLGAWLAGYGDSASAKLCLWSAGGSLVRNGPTFTVAGAGFALGAAYNYEQGITDYIVNGGTSLYVGWSRNPADSSGHQFPLTGSGSHIDDTQTGTWPASFSGEVSAGGQIGAYLEYEKSNSVPNKPSLVSPADGARITDNTPTLDWSHNDPDGDPQARRQVQVDNSSGFGSPHDSGDDATSTTSYTVPSGILSNGQKYYWRVRTADAEGYGPWSSTRDFTVNTPPTVTPTDPPVNGHCVVPNNSSDAAEWAAGTAQATVRFKWTFADADGDGQAGYQLRIYLAASGGTPWADSGDRSSSSKSHDTSTKFVMGTIYYWTIQVRDASGEWSAESARIPFKVSWAQAIYEFAVPGGALSSAWALTWAYSGTGGQLALFFAGATGPNGAGRTAWKTTIGQVTPAPYLNILVRLVSNVVGSGLTVTNMTFNYIATAIQPEKWTFGTVSPDWMLDPEVRRYGSQALRMIRSTAVGERVAYPFTKTTDDDFTVSANTEYIASCYVKTDAPLASGVRIEVRSKGAGGVAWGAAEILDGSGNLALDTSAYKEGWQRIWVHFRSADVDGLRLAIVQDAAGAVIGDKFWIDAVQLEEGATASPWKPGMVGNPVVLDVGGIAVDESAGGIFRLRDNAGRVAQLADILNAVDAYPALMRQERDTDFTGIVAGTVTTVPMNNLVRQDDPLDDLAINTPGPGEVTINRAGWYRCDAGIFWDANDTGRREMFVRGPASAVVGGSVAGASNFSATIGFYQSATSGPIYMAVGDIFRVQVRHSAAVNMKVLASRGTFISVTRLRS